MLQTLLLLKMKKMQEKAVRGQATRLLLKELPRCRRAA